MYGHLIDFYFVENSTFSHCIHYDTYFFFLCWISTQFLCDRMSKNYIFHRFVLQASRSISDLTSEICGVARLKDGPLETRLRYWFHSILATDTKNKAGRSR